jgi:hypothetical protein
MGRHPKLFTKPAVRAEKFATGSPSIADIDYQTYGGDNAGTSNVALWEWPCENRNSLPQLKMGMAVTSFAFTPLSLR